MKLNLYGKVKHIRDYTYEADEKIGEVLKGKREKSSYLDEDRQFTFNKKGKIIEESYYKLDSSIDEKFIFKYDDKGNVAFPKNCFSIFLILLYKPKI